jgi:hypothetical protein
MVGDVPDFVRRMLAVLPNGWFGGPATPPQQPTYLQALLAGFGTAWSAIYALITDLKLLARLATVYGPFLDMASVDFFGPSLPRRPQETDTEFRVRLQQALLRQRGTRSALVIALEELTGNTPSIFEPARPDDTGGYASGGVGYSAAGGWGNLDLPYQSFVMVERPSAGGIANFAGYGTGGYSYYGNLDMITIPVTDSDIFATVSAILPAGYIAWTSIRG